MLVWSGKGWAVPATVFVSALATEFITEAICKNAEYYQGHRWPLSLALTVSAVLTWEFDQKWASVPTRELVDINTAERVTIRRDDSFFFIPIRIWSFILLAIAALVMALGPQPDY